MSQLAPVPVVDRSAMGHAMGCWTTGVAVITTVDRNGRPHGMTVNSLTSVSLDPPLLLACLTHGARTAGAVLDAGRFAVSILAARHEPIARRFADRGEDHFAGLPPTTATTSSPPCPAHSPTSTAPSTGTSTPATTSSCSAPCSAPATAMGNPWRSSAAASATTPTVVTNPSTGSSKPTLGWRAAHRWSRRELNRHSRP